MFEFPSADLKRLGIDRSVKYRTLAKLKTAGLITVEHAHGRATRVTRRWKWVMLGHHTQ
jgi:predicted transcriptional regulator